MLSSLLVNIDQQSTLHNSIPLVNFNNKDQIIFILDIFSCFWYFWVLYEFAAHSEKNIQKVNISKRKVDNFFLCGYY